MKRPLLTLSLFLFAFTTIIHAQTQTLASGPTLSFTNATGFSDNIAADGEGGSVTISDFDIQVMPINSAGTKLIADPLQYHDMADWGVPPMITYGGVNSFYGWSIKSATGAEFSLFSFDFNDWGEWSGANFTVQAFRNGVSTGTVNFVGNTNNNNIHLTRPGVLSPVFSNVDEVRVYKQGGADSWIGINNIKISTPTTVLPVSWLSFTAKKESNGVLLNWSTATEQNAKDFVVQHSIDGRNWNSLAIIDAAVNSSAVRKYSYLHNIGTSAVHYYRILQRDLDGKESYSSVIVVNASKGKSLDVYPNPVVNGEVRVKLDKEETVQLFSADGKPVFEKKLPAGIQLLQLPRLKKGMFIMKAGAQTVTILVP